MVGITAATIVILLSGGGDVEHYLTGIKKDVKKHVDDKPRRDIILKESKQLSKELKTMSKAINGHLDEFVSVHADFSSTAAEYDEVIQLLVSDQRSAFARILDARDILKENLTREEWNAIFPEMNEE